MYGRSLVGTTCLATRGGIYDRLAREHRLLGRYDHARPGDGNGVYGYADGGMADFFKKVEAICYRN